MVKQNTFGAPPRIVGQGSQIDLILSQGEDVARRASEAMAAVKDLLTDENIARVSATLQNLQTISARLADERSVIVQSGEAARSLALLSNQLRHDLSGLDGAVASLEAAGGKANAETLPQITNAANELSRAAEAVSDLADSLDNNPLLNSRSNRRTVELAP
jgi:phospholipid/cholesterol/gamma-HCH transport system substrate-binding protein